MRFVTIVGLLTVILPFAARAQDAAKPTPDCGKLTMVNSIQMIRDVSGTREMVPLGFITPAAKDATPRGSIDERYFMLDTGSSRTTISPLAVGQLKLSRKSGTMALQDITGHATSGVVEGADFVLGNMRGTPRTLSIFPSELGLDGLFGLDYLMGFDADVDFGTDKLNYFSPDHCPGAVQYWSAPVVAALPMKLDANGHVSVPVELDGHEFTAIIDSGAPRSTLRQDLAEYTFDLTLGNADTPPSGIMNGDENAKTYIHTFSHLAFGPVEVIHPILQTVPLPRPTIAGTPYRMVPPEMIIGMDVLRKLHIYMAFNEKKLYISQAASPATAPLPDDYFSDALADIGEFLAISPNSPELIAARCHWRAMANRELDGALADCDQILKADENTAAQPSVTSEMKSAALQAKALIFYRQAKYRDTVETENAALKIEPNTSESLMLRAYAKGRLGDMAGHDADIVAANAIDHDAVAYFKRLGIDGS